MNVRPFRAAALLLAAMALGGCTTPAPEPAPTPTGFTHEAEAFAAAEATYRAYVDALNQIDLSDPATFEPAFALTTGEANANERQNLSKMHADGWHKDGQTTLHRFAGKSAELKFGDVTAVVCLDVSDVRVADASLNSVVSSERPPRYALLVEFVSAPNLQIATSNAIEDRSCV